MPHYQTILNHYIWLEQQIDQANTDGNDQRFQALVDAREALSSEIDHAQIYENLAYIDQRIRYHNDCEEQAAYELQEEDDLIEWRELLDQLQAAEAAAGGVPA